MRKNTNKQDTINFVYCRKSAKVRVRLSFRATENLIEKTDTKHNKNNNEYSTVITAKFHEFLSAFLRAVYGISVTLNTRNVVCDEKRYRGVFDTN